MIEESEVTVTVMVLLDSGPLHELIFCTELVIIIAAPRYMILLCICFKLK